MRTPVDSSRNPLFADLLRGIHLRKSSYLRPEYRAPWGFSIGEPPFRYLTRLRIDAAASRLRTSDDKLSAIATSVGYDSVAALAKAFKRHMGMTPGEYRQASHGRAN